MSTITATTKDRINLAIRRMHRQLAVKREGRPAVLVRMRYGIMDVARQNIVLQSMIKCCSECEALLHSHGDIVEVLPDGTLCSYLFPWIQTDTNNDYTEFLQLMNGALTMADPYKGPYALVSDLTHVNYMSIPTASCSNKGIGHIDIPDFDALSECDYRLEQVQMLCEVFRNYLIDSQTASDISMARDEIVAYHPRPGTPGQEALHAFLTEGILQIAKPNDAWGNRNRLYYYLMQNPDIGEVEFRLFILAIYGHRRGGRLTVTEILEASSRGYRSPVKDTTVITALQTVMGLRIQGRLQDLELYWRAAEPVATTSWKRMSVPTADYTRLSFQPVTPSPLPDPVTVGHVEFQTDIIPKALAIGQIFEEGDEVPVVIPMVPHRRSTSTKIQMKYFVPGPDDIMWPVVGTCRPAQYRWLKDKILWFSALTKCTSPTKHGVGLFVSRATEENLVFRAALIAMAENLIPPYDDAARRDGSDRTDSSAITIPVRTDDGVITLPLSLNARYVVLDKAGWHVYRVVTEEDPARLRLVASDPTLGINTVLTDKDRNYYTPR